MKQNCNVRIENFEYSKKIQYQELLLARELIQNRDQTDYQILRVKVTLLYNNNNKKNTIEHLQYWYHYNLVA